MNVPFLLLELVTWVGVPVVVAICLKQIVDDVRKQRAEAPDPFVSRLRHPANDIFERWHEPMVETYSPPREKVWEPWRMEEQELEERPRRRPAPTFGWRQ